jgi:hypothetical protein
MITSQAVEHATTSRHVSLSSRPRLPIEVGSGAATRPLAPDPASKWRGPRRPMAPDPVSMLRRAPVLSRVLWLRTPPPCRRGLRRCHTSYDSGLHLPVEEGSNTATCPMVLYGLQDVGIKKGTSMCFQGALAWFQGMLAWFQGTLVRAIEACNMCGQAASLRPA